MACPLRGNVSGGNRLPSAAFSRMKNMWAMPSFKNGLRRTSLQKPRKSTRAKPAVLCGERAPAHCQQIRLARGASRMDGRRPQKLHIFTVFEFDHLRRLRQPVWTKDLAFYHTIMIWSGSAMAGKMAAQNVDAAIFTPKNWMLPSKGPCAI